ncbi:glutaredoxin family protein [Kocuria sp. cx-455]|uniref:glutaredoxin family protein n=1 Tax=Kocuria sp. cx-455 TaxID=2771377 RepID=UPI001685316F|nr:glutaredoxin family protein [Kocuria sp. cx-455]MBD2764182.1 glutaredoxin family protein [Kocuria sp. cx-455]
MSSPQKPQKPQKPLLSAENWAAAAPAHHVTLLTKDGCHLCADARTVVAAACRDTGSEFSEVDITTDAALLRDYAHVIPVVFVDGVPWDQLRIDERRLRNVLG